MLQQRLGLCLPTLRPLGKWTPARETCLVGWYKFATGVTFNASLPYGVSQWDDQSTNANHLVQGTISEQPTYQGIPGPTHGQISFDPVDSQHLDFTNQIAITGDFTMAFRLNITLIGGVLLADGDEPNEWMKTILTNTIRFKIGGSVINLTLDGTDIWGDGYLVFTRESGLISTWFNGVLQADTETLAGTVRIDTFGIRQPTNNPFGGWVSEIQIYSCSNSELTSEVINSIKNL